MESSIVDSDLPSDPNSMESSTFDSDLSFNPDTMERSAVDSDLPSNLQWLCCQVHYFCLAWNDNSLCQSFQFADNILDVLLPMLIACAHRQCHECAMKPKFALVDEEAPPEARDEDRIGNLNEIVEGALAALKAQEGEGTEIDKARGEMQGGQLSDGTKKTYHAEHFAKA